MKVENVTPTEKTRQSALLEIVYPSEIQQPLIFVVIASRYEDRWIFVRHKDRDTYEIPAGHIEPGEDPTEAAKRELYEESGAIEYTLDLVSPYGARIDGTPMIYGLLFYAQVTRLGKLPEYEIAERAFFENIPEHLTYPEIQPLLIEKVCTWLKENRPS